MSLVKLALDPIVPNPAFQDTLDKLTNKLSTNLNRQILKNIDNPAGLSKTRVNLTPEFNNQRVETYVDNSI